MRPDGRPAIACHLVLAESAGLQALVFAPGSGQTSRAYWRSAGRDGGPMHLCLGELGARFAVDPRI